MTQKAGLVFQEIKPLFFQFYSINSLHRVPKFVMHLKGDFASMMEILSNNIYNVHFMSLILKYGQFNVI